MKSKNIRLEKIRRFIRDHEVGTQEEIVEHLRRRHLSNPSDGITGYQRIGHRKTPSERYDLCL